MNWIDGIGYLASVLILSTFFMKTMIPLRSIAMASNLAFIIYSFLGQLYPTLILHLLLLPLNVLRLLQMRKLIAEVKEIYKGEFSLNFMIPFMAKEKFKKTDILFRKGDKANKLYLLRKGSVLLPEIGISVSEGEIIGEMGIFSPDRERTASAICETDLDVLTLTEEKVVQLYYQNPKFGFYLMRLTIHRLLSNASLNKEIESQNASRNH